MPRALPQPDGNRNPAYSLDVAGWLAAPLTGSLENHISAHRKSRQHERPRRKLLNNTVQVFGQAGMVERWRQVFRATAVAHIETNDTHPRLEGGLGQVQHVGRLARRRQAVDRDDRPTGFPIGAGVQMSQHLHIGGRLKIFLFAKPLTPAERRGPVARDDGLEIAIPQKGPVRGVAPISEGLGVEDSLDKDVLQAEVGLETTLC